MAGIFAWSILAASVCVIFCTMKKYWWAPIVGTIHEIPWAGYAIAVESIPLLCTTILYTFVFAFSIRKWYRERQVNYYQLCPGCLEYTEVHLCTSKELCFDCRARNRREINHEKRR